MSDEKRDGGASREQQIPQKLALAEAITLIAVRFWRNAAYLAPQAPNFGRGSACF
jgi:hypothetical protein